MDNEKLYSISLEVLAKNEEEAKQMLISQIEDYIKECKIDND